MVLDSLATDSSAEDVFEGESEHDQQITRSHRALQQGRDLEVMGMDREG